ncbi:MAG: ORF6C domain-containing protein [Bacillota bacterium]|nr:ORF6C domain-containing protein [Bacillota bacterium]
MNNLKIFNSEEFGDIRTVTIGNEPMFCLADVCRILEIKNVSDCKSRLMTKGIATTDTLTNGGVQKMTFISEANLYKTIFQSRKESAERFTDWVTSEVLPSIRKTGQYTKPMTLPEQIQVLAQGTLDNTERINKVEQDLKDFKNDMPLLGIECQKITWAKNHKVVPLLGGKESEAYKNKSLRTKIYKDIDKQLRREFGVNSYKAIKRSQCDLAIDIINRYELPFVLKEEIENTNAQLTLNGIA